MARARTEAAQAPNAWIARPAISTGRRRERADDAAR